MMQMYGDGGGGGVDDNDDDNTYLYTCNKYYRSILLI